jgi:chemotaxis protein MotB
MRKLTVLIGVVALAACGISKEQYGAKEAEAAKYKQAMQDESGKVAALESKTKALEQQNAALKTQVGDMEKKLGETTEAKAQLELTTAKLKEQGGEYQKRNEELQGKLTVRLSDRVLFKESSSKLTPEAKRALDSIADAVAQLKGKNVLVVGYTDDTEAGGKDAASRRWQLSAARAMEVAKYLTGRGLDPKLIGVAGFGEARPIAPNDSLANRALNRRAEIALTPADAKLNTVDIKPATLKTN